MPLLLKSNSLFVAYNNHPNELVYNLLVFNSAPLIHYGNESEHNRGLNGAFIPAFSEQSVLHCVTAGALFGFFRFLFSIPFMTPADESRPTYVS